jgi:hypothetical protein
MSLMGHELPLRGQVGMSALTPKAAAAVAESCVRYGPIATFRTAKNIAPLRCQIIEKLVTDLPIWT